MEQGQGPVEGEGQGEGPGPVEGEGQGEGLGPVEGAGQGPVEELHQEGPQAAALRREEDPYQEEVLPREEDPYQEGPQAAALPLERARHPGGQEVGADLAGVMETGKEEEAVPLLEPEEHLGLEGRQG